MSQASSMGGSPFGSAGWHTENPIFSAIGGAVKEGVTGGKQESGASQRMAAQRESHQKREEDMRDSALANQKALDDGFAANMKGAEDFFAQLAELTSSSSMASGIDFQSIYPQGVLNVEKMAEQQDREAQAILRSTMDRSWGGSPSGTTSSGMPTNLLGDR